MICSQEILALFMGIVEGLTEFLPISSTGHLILAQETVQFKVDQNNFFDVFIQLGAILAVVVLYWRRFIGLLDFSSAQETKLLPSIMRKGEGMLGPVGLLKLALACAPAFICGALFYAKIKDHLMSPLPVALALIVGGIIMIVIEKKNKTKRANSLEQLSYQQCFLIGLIQCFSLWPGVSRSGSTIIGGLLVGLERSAAAEFSFLIAVPVMLGAVTFDFLKSYDSLTFTMLPLFLIGLISSFITAVVAIRFMLAVLKRFTFVPFGVYRIAVGIVVLILLLG